MWEKVLDKGWIVFKYRYVENINILLFCKYINILCIVDEYIENF